MNTWWQNFWARWRSSKTLIVVIVFVAHFIDTVSLTCLVPILPDYLFQINHRNNGQPSHISLSLWTNLSNHSTDSSMGVTQSQALLYSVAIDKNFSNADHLRIQNFTAELIEFQHQQEKVDLIQENGPLGVLYGFNSFTQLVANPFVAILVSRIGHTIPMLCGFAITFISTFMFALADNYWLLLISRSIQGFGTAFTLIAGGSMLAERFRDDEERGKMMGHVASGLSLGMAVGPTFGGFFYYHFGKPAPFLILAAFSLVDGLLRLSIVSTKADSETEQLVGHSDRRSTSMFTLARDPFICITIGAPLVTFLAMAVVEATLPTHLMVATTSVTPLVQGLIFVPFSIGLVISQNLFGALAFQMGRWLCAVFGLLTVAISLISIPLLKSVAILSVPQFAFGVGVDYGNAFALFETAVGIPLMLGSPLGGYLVRFIGFQWTLFIVAAIGVLYVPLLLIVHNRINIPQN